MTRARVLIGLACVVFFGAGFGAGHWQGNKTGYSGGFADGKRNGEVQAARKGPPTTRNKQHALAALQGTDAWKALPELAEGEAEALAAVANEAPSPCSRDARRGVSLATSLLDAERGCVSSPGSLRLGLAALRSFPDDPGEATAVLRVEKRVQPNIEGRALRGDPNASVVVVEWSDFQCPYCTRATRIVDELLNARTDVAFVYKHMPLSFHPAAEPAALAAEAAGVQGRFWEMHDELFALGKGIGDYVDRDGSIGDSGPVPFEDLAKEIGLDVEQFRSDMRSDAVAAIVQGDKEEASALGVSGTPTFFVGDRRVRERLSPPVLSALIDKAAAEREFRFSWDLKPAPK